MKCIDFDKAFSMYAMKWLREHGKQYKNYDEMEAAMPDIYDSFLDTPADFLGNRKPGEYFLQWDDAKLLVDWMEDYYKQRVPVPDMLLNRIAELGDAAGQRLMQLLQKERTPEEARMTAVSLLEEMGSAMPMELYIDWQINREEEDALCDAACDSLAQMGEAAVQPMLNALPDANDAGKEALCGILSRYPDPEGIVLRELLRLICLPDADVAVLAGYLGRLGDERALETLIDLALDEDVGYLDYIELRSAIEQLGGDAPERSFDETDPEYEALAGLQMSWMDRDGGDEKTEDRTDGDLLQ
ncbi:MAG: HEAT repeat domain-containing protein [Clostridia bacterium]|nr:HEAT repeat domain-containing protein [Clostridia bacterium]